MAMGGVQTRVRTDEAAFVIPVGIRLTANQRAQLVATGQELGVPFVITESGASRATSNHVRRSTIRNLVAVKRGSIKLVGCEGKGSMVSLTFVYDASVPARAHIYLKARDGCVSSAGGPVNAVSVSDAKVTWGPIRLVEGCDMVFDSASLGLVVHESVMLADRAKNSKENFRIGKSYDVILHLEPDTAAGAAGAAGAHHAKPAPRLGSLLGLGIFGGKKDAEAEGGAEGAGGDSEAGVSRRGRALPPNDDDADRASKDALGSPIRVSSINLAPRKLQVDLDQDDEEDEDEEEADEGVGAWREVSTADEDGPESHVKMKAVEMAVTRPNKSSWLSARRRGTPEKEAPSSPRGGPAASAPTASASSSSSSSPPVPRNVARCEVTYTYLDNSRSKRPAASPSPSRGGAEVSSASPASAKADEDAGAGSEAGRATMALRPVLQRLHVGSTLFAMHDIYGVDSKAGAENEMADCVICLSTPRAVFVYPCRHMCLCADCAESMPPQGIKCPMCRNPAKMLISINSPSVST